MTVVVPVAMALKPAMVKDTFGLIALMRALAGMPVPEMNMPTARPEVFPQFTTVGVVVVLVVQFGTVIVTVAFCKTMPARRPVVLSQVTVVLPVPLPAELSTQLVRFTDLPT